MLIVVGGLPGTGKSSIAKLFAAQISATYLRIDEIEHALRSAPGFHGDVGPAGYIVACALATSNRGIGRPVVADCVNPVCASRQAWREVGSRACAPVIEIEVVCSDEMEHRRRVEEPQPDIAGFGLPSWQSVQAHQYEMWTEPRLVIDTATLAPEEAVAVIERHIEDQRLSHWPPSETTASRPVR